MNEPPLAKPRRGGSAAPARAAHLRAPPPGLARCPLRLRLPPLGASQLQPLPASPPAGLSRPEDRRWPGPPPPGLPGSALQPQRAGAGDCGRAHGRRLARLRRGVREPAAGGGLRPGRGLPWTRGGGRGTEGTRSWGLSRISRQGRGSV